MDQSSMLSRLQQCLHQWRANVPRQARMVVLLVAVALTLATWTPMAAAALGINLVGWEQFVHQTCGPFCHQLPSRSFHVGHHAFPLCARCTGMWLGITLGVALAMLWVPRHRWMIGTLTAIGFTSASAFDMLREESTGVAYAGVRATLGFFLFVGVTLAVSYDVLAVLVGTVRGFAGLVQRSRPRASAP